MDAETCYRVAQLYTLRAEAFARLYALREQTLRRQQKGIQAHERANELLANASQIYKRIHASRPG